MSGCSDFAYANRVTITTTSTKYHQVSSPKITKHTVAPSQSCQKKSYTDLSKVVTLVHGSSNITKRIVSKLKGRTIDNIKKHYNSKTDDKLKIENKIYKFGERNSGFNARGDVQDFYELRDYHYENGSLFEDPQFPASDSSLFYSQRPDRRIQWLRPHEISDDPKLFVEGFSRFDIQQGELGDCWLLAAAANLTMFRRLFFQVVPDDQAFDEKYAGIFHFRFWQYGRWIDVVIDDRLPTYHGKLVYLHSAEENEYWSALLEKAYAKLHGSYEALKGGSTCEAMEDFTGGVTEMYDLENSPPDLFQIIKKAFERSSMMGCSIEPDPNVLEAETGEGLVKGHAYSITKVRYVEIRTPNTSGKIPLLRLRNPWGNDTEWNGAWSDQSPEWRFIPDHEKEDLGLNFDDDGEFWMSYKDFQKYFDRIEICNLSPDSVSDDSGKRWELSYYEGEWVKGVTAGGCRNFLDTFWSNPQYRITLTQVDEDSNDNKCTVIIALMQKNRRQQRKMGLDVLTIGFAIYYLPDPNSVPKPLDRNFFKYNASVGRSPSFINLREVTCRFRLPPGTYCIVPSTFDPNEEGEFLIRVFSENQNHMEVHDLEVGYGKKEAKALQAVRRASADPGETIKLQDTFLRLAGNAEEIDWKKFKELLAIALSNDCSEISRNRVEDVSAAPGQTETQGESNLLTLLLNLVCGAICKDTPLADFIPKVDETPLLSSQPKGFSNDVCRSLVALADKNCSGKLGYEEFADLWADISHWITIFKKFDVDNSNNLSGFELREALTSAGYSLNNHTLNILMHRYGNGQGAMEFDEFIMCIVRLKHMIDAFKERDPDGTDEATFPISEFIDTTLYS
ncbi:PREDICTED: calpain-A-like isoform X2 [Nicrophorus vespilloides]|uniref:Calpain-A-like isoform X2 n=1 Tax=Nicrophorus vespilloides TaxID=110193 RepID=A0ABM1MWS0_NICVS|nr:PREDICTED: calpain-A-like isoform X2 [Nicrophorus vespilloides]